ncbi:Glucan-binding domain-containing protein (YG repeat) [Granulicatella balaenopterae]|uniref:Glucan-binding domain-containing protein (YG repeat) n=1 Tax=Granulicatella balaenopterae TaxID=137733 RepID=A0A1H9LX98_9LACT|nr:polysaccharide lyase family 8 super-sandwich domain-containing protein [Granulicatella balaenopterae]SER15988.1 Glucan-binding domain-containing protein (YG repeat) [Granulicatella balaenopterae]
MKNAKKVTIGMACCLGIGLGTTTVLAETTTLNGIVTVAPEQNAVLNGDFSQISAQLANGWSNQSAENWKVWIAKGSHNPIIEITKNHELKMSGTESFRAAVTQEIKNIDTDKEYLLSYRVKTEDLHSKGVHVRLQFKDAANKSIEPHTVTKPIIDNSDWQEVTEVVKPPKDTAKILLEIFFEQGTGTAYIDDVSFTEQVQVATDSQWDDITELPLPLDKVFIPQVAGDQLSVANDEIVMIKDNMIFPKKAGKVMLTVTNPDLGYTKEIPVVVSEATQDYFDEMRQQWSDSLVGNHFYNEKNPQMQQMQAEIDQDTKEYLASLNRAADRTYLWDDLQFGTKKSSSITKSYRRIQRIAQAVTNEQSAYYMNSDAIKEIRSMMAWMNEHIYNETKSIDGNWWDYEIGSPRALDNTLVLMYPYFSAEEITNYTKPIAKFVPDATMMMMLVNPKRAIGGNQIDIGKVKLISNVLVKNEAEVNKAIDAIGSVLTYSNGIEGFFPDGSYIDHTNVAYTGAYGNVLIDGFSQLLPTIQKSEHKIPTNLLNIAQGWIEKSFLPLIYKGELMDMSRGRSISREKSEDHVAAVEVLRGAARIAQCFDDSTRMKLDGMIKGILQDDTYYSVYNNLKSYSDIALFEDLLADDSIQATHRDSYIALFNKMNKIAIYNQEKDIAFGISMHSNHILNYEYMNKENAHGWHMADGMVYLYNNDLAQYSDGYWPTINAKRLPGTTVVAEDLESGGATSTVSPNEFVGGTQLDNQYATVAMDFTNWNQKLSLHKAWILLGDKLVCLGSNIVDTANEHAETIIENRKVTNQDATLYINETKATDGLHEKAETAFVEFSDHAKNIGYQFLQPTALHTIKETRTASWKEINANQSDTPVTNEFITLWQEHQANVPDTYAYVIYPKRTQEEFAKEMKDNPIELVANTNDLQMVLDKSENIWGVVKYTDEATKVGDDITLTAKGVYVIKEDKLKNCYQLSYYNPENPSEVELSTIATTPTASTTEIIKAYTEDAPYMVFSISKEDKAKAEHEAKVTEAVKEVKTLTTLTADEQQVFIDELQKATVGSDLNVIVQKAKDLAAEKEAKAEHEAKVQAAKKQIEAMTGLTDAEKTNFNKQLDNTKVGDNLTPIIEEAQKLSSQHIAEQKPSKQRGWIKENGFWTYYKKDGQKAIGWLPEGKNWYFFNEKAEMQTGWLKDGNNWYYLKDNGQMARGWEVINGTYYLFKDWGGMAQGEWMPVGEDWFYIHSDGTYAHDEWVGSFYLKQYGHMAHNEWIYDNHYQSWFYINEDGTYAHDTWNGAYYLKQWGHMAHNEWIYDNHYQSWFFINEDGSYAQNQWVGAYYLKDWGYMAHNEWIYDKNYANWFKVDANGYYLHDTWVGDYYLKTNGEMAKDEWVYSGHHWYHFAKNGQYIK